LMVYVLKIDHCLGRYPAYLELPLELADDVDVLTHEFSEVHIGWLLHTVMHDDSESKWSGKGEIPVELNPKFVLNFLEDHMVQHVMVSLHTISGYGSRIISPEAYAELLPWRKKTL